MKAAVVHGLGQIPRHDDFPDPVAKGDETLVTVTAAALSQVTRSRASGRHYSSSARFPFVAGIDGVGRLTDGQRVYFVFPTAPHGAMAERTVVPTSQCLPLPDDIDDETAAAIANPGMSSWAAYVERARLRPGETVLVNGATGASGRLAVRIAKHLGAKKVIATGRDPGKLEAVGADAIVPLIKDEHSLKMAMLAAFAEGVDVVIDYLGGRSAELILSVAAEAAAQTAPLRFVQVGALSSPDMVLPGSILRSSAIQLLESGIGSVPLDQLIAAIGGVLNAAGPVVLHIATDVVPLTNVEAAWNREDGTRRTVFTLDQ